MFGLGSKRIYLDYASATPVLTEAKRAYAQAELLVGNPGSLHREGVLADAALEAAREVVARELSCKPREVLFTSGLTEANNLAILGFARALEERTPLSSIHAITSAIEHPSVLESFRELEHRGVRVTYLAPTAKGIVPAEAVAEVLTEHTRFVSIGWANNETGTLQPLARISRALKEYAKAHGLKIALHSDASQAPLFRHPAVHTLGIDLLSLGSNKLYGPRGAGALYVSNTTELYAEHVGGGQERGLRSGTENTAALAGFAEALRVGALEREKESRRMLTLKGILMKGVLEAIPEAVVNGDPNHTLPHILNISFPGVSGEYLTLALDTKGVAVSARSACTEGDGKHSHVIAAMVGKDEAAMWRAGSAMRFSMGRQTSEKEVHRALRIVIETVRSVKEG